MTPRMSYLFAKKQTKEITTRISISLGIELLLSVGCCFGLISVADVFVPFFFGPGYKPVILLLKLMAPILIFICVSTCLGSHYYVPSGNILSGTKLTLIGSIVNIFINIPMIKFFGARGAVIASLLAEGVIAVLYAVFCRRKIKYERICCQLYKKIIAGILMCFLCSWVGKTIKCVPFMLLLLQVIIGVLFYAIVLLLMKDNSIFLIYRIIEDKIISVRKRYNANR